jgi:hypothetical protein
MDQIEELAALPTTQDQRGGFQNCNPFHHDAYHMGQQIGKNLIMMHANHPDEICKYLILVDQLTGKQVRINIDVIFGETGTITSA